LPPLIVVPGATSQASELQVNIRRFAAEFRASRIGRSLIMYQLAPVILVDLIRTYFAEAPGGASWFGALLQSELSGVLNLMHTDSARHSGVSSKVDRGTFKRKMRWENKLHA